MEKVADVQKRIDSAYSGLEINDCIMLAFRQTVAQYSIPKKYFDDFIQGIKMDLDKKRYANFEELNVYCYRVSGTIGFIMLKVFGYQDARAVEAITSERRI